MKKLFDETHDYSPQEARRTLWYQLDRADGLDFLSGPVEEHGVSFLQPSDYKQLGRTVVDLVKQDLADEQAKKATETHWILYTDRVDQDALGEKVRFTIMLRHRGRVVAADVMHGDFVFASAFREVAKLKQSLTMDVAEALGL